MNALGDMEGEVRVYLECVGMVFASLTRDRSQEVSQSHYHLYSSNLVSTYVGIGRVWQAWVPINSWGDTGQLEETSRSKHIY